MNAHQRAFQQDSQEQYSEWREFVKKERGSYCSNLLLLGNHLLWATCMGCVTWKPYDWLFIKIFTFPETGMEYVEAFEDGSTPYHAMPYHAIPYHAIPFKAFEDGRLVASQAGEFTLEGSPVSFLLPRPDHSHPHFVFIPILHLSTILSSPEPRWQMCIYTCWSLNCSSAITVAAPL